MEPLFELVGAWWWVAPTVVGLGAVSYGVLTTGRRRARRLELDAARHEVTTAHAAHAAARADVRSAHADVLAAQAQRGADGLLGVAKARQALHEAKRRQRTAMLTLRAKRSGVRAARAQIAASSAPLPLARLMARHDAVTARWLEYETDVARVIAFPQMSDARHPSTAAFLDAQREARRMRPESERARISAEDFLEYRDAVRALESAFVAAEQDAARSASRGTAPLSAPTWTERLTDGIGRLPLVISESVRAVVDPAAAAPPAPASSTPASPRADSTVSPPRRATPAPAQPAPAQPDNLPAQSAPAPAPAAPGQPDPISVRATPAPATPAPAAPASAETASEPADRSVQTDAPAPHPVWPVPSRTSRPSRPPAQR